MIWGQAIKSTIAIIYVSMMLAGAGTLAALVPYVIPELLPTDPFLLSTRPQPQSADPVSPLLTVAEQASASTVTVIGNSFGEGSVGSGFFISADGLVVTSAHVVDDARGRYAVITADGKRYGVQEVVRSNTNDIAVLRTSASDVVSLPLATAESVAAGQPVATVGPGAGWVASSGRVIGTDRNVVTDIHTIERDVIQVETLIRPGSSGGPLLNEEGEVVGVVFAFSLENPSMGFAIPADRVSALVQQVNSLRHPLVLHSEPALPAFSL